MKVIALMDNINSEHKGLIAEHGLSFFIDTGETKLVFDCGGSINPFLNARQLNVSFEDVKTVIISHGHYDHGTGFIDAVDIIKPKKLITGKGFLREKYAYNGTTQTYLGVGFDKNFLDNKKISHIECSDIYQIDSNCYVISNFTRNHEFETIPNRFVFYDNGEIELDDFSDEVCLVVDTEKGLVVIVGCSHPGIMNMLCSIKERFNKDIYAVFGGTHLVEADEYRIKESLKEMKTLGVKATFMSHCSGEKAIEIARNTEGIIAAPLKVGGVVIIK